MEVKIGILNAAREVSVNYTGTLEELEKAVNEALASETVLKLNDDKGRQVFIPASAIAYVEADSQSSRQVGFGRL
ncbi:MAG: DUF3107 domain-containing protein [Propionibacteriaceae bacterium]|jgi:hypothetical protein|nr:DUF3107 domain-containing protein [Propionibacteriaceae bacterium]